MSDVPPALPVFDETWNADTLREIHGLCVSVMPQLLREIEAVDSKTVAVFTLASGVIGLGPALSKTDSISFDAWILWGLAGAAWLAVCYNTYQAYRPRGVRIGPDPRLMLTSDWLTLKLPQFHAFRLRDMAVTAGLCFTAIEQKVRHFQNVMVCAGIEVALAVGAILRG